MKLSTLILSICLYNIANAAPVSKKDPQVSLNDKETITGTYKLNSTVESYLGIPFALPPVDELRFRRPVAYNKSYDGFKATKFSSGCASIELTGSGGLGGALLNYASYLTPEYKMGMMSLVSPQAADEDCLYLNVYRPANISSKEKLPVMVWIYGGAFISGASNTYPGEVFIKESLDMKKPVIFVSLNYRLGPFGFLGGDDIVSEGNANAGLFDQRLALEWVADHIEQFGGDPEKVTIFGESAGAMSVAHHMILNDGDHTYKNKPLFSAGIMQSGGALPFDDARSARPQAAYDSIVKSVGCDSESDKLSCLRTKNMTEIAQSLGNYTLADAFIAFSPRADGGALKKNSYDMFREGKFAKIPYITGCQEDEGTLFGSILNVKNSDELSKTFKSFFPKASEDTMKALMEYYPDDPAQGSPFRTSNLNVRSPAFKRISAVLTDLLFHAPRRLMIEVTPAQVPIYTYFSTVGYGIPYLGTFHASDLVWQYFLDFGPSKAYKRYWIAFANDHDPNGSTDLPLWINHNKTLTNMQKIELGGYGLQVDDFRKESIGFFMNETSLVI